MSFSIPAGSVTALVGPSGSGKSTISKLIARFWDIRKGQITIGGMDVSTIEPEHLMRCMSFVFQDVTLFNDTVFNNIRVGNRNATEEQVMAAAKAAYCDEFIQRLPDGYQTVLGENGSTLSGGERQRIAIARAISLHPEVLICDEATSALDVSIQQEIMALLKEHQDETNYAILFISHDLALVENFSQQVVVMYLGRIVEIMNGAAFRMHARHPYTKALLSSVFSIDDDPDKEIYVLDGEAQSATGTITGCVFCNRCSQAKDICRREAPVLKPIRPRP